MKENWEINWKDYYQILQVHPSAEPEVIKVAFERLARKYHPDINKAPTATQRMKDLNEAFEILNDVEKRKTYHAVYLQWVGKTNSGFSNSNAPSPNHPLPTPKPEVNPTTIRFTDVIPGETRKDSFIVKNSGGPFSKIWMSNTNSWLKIVSQRPLYGTGKLPLFVEIEARGLEWGKTYVDNIIIKLDDVETHVRVELNTRIKVEQTNQNWNNETPSSGGENQTYDSSEKSKYGTKQTRQYKKETTRKSNFGSFLFAGILIAIIMVLVSFLINHDKASNSLSSNPTNSKSITPSTLSSISTNSKSTIPNTVTSKSTPVNSTANITLSKTSGSPGTLISISGTGFGAAEDVNVTFDGNLISTSSADQSGNWRAICDIPASSSGPHDIKVNGLITTFVPAKTFLTTASISLSPSVAKYGDIITISGYGFGSNATLNLANTSLSGKALVSKESVPMADNMGNITFTLFTSTETLPGPYNLVVSDSLGNQADATLTFLPLTHTTTISQAESLPTISLSSNYGISGSLLTIKGFNFSPFSYVTLDDSPTYSFPISPPGLWDCIWNDIPFGNQTQTYKTDGNGNFVASFNLSNDCCADTYDIIGTDTTWDKASSAFTVVKDELDVR